MLIFTGGYKSWSVVSAMQDLGMVVVATGTEKSTEEDKARIKELMGPDARMISDNDQTALIAAFHECEADILIAGDRYIYPTLKSRIPFLDIGHVRRIGYAGYDGLIELARNIDHAVHSPVWSLVRSRPSSAHPASRRGGVNGRNPHPHQGAVRQSAQSQQPIGASLAFLGLAELHAVEHGARGCTSFNKLFFMRHFNGADPAPDHGDGPDHHRSRRGRRCRHGAGDHLRKKRAARHRTGDDGPVRNAGRRVPRTIQEFRKKHPEHAGVAVVPVSASDTLGCLETGFAAAVEAMIKILVLRRPVARKKPRQVNVLASSMLTPGDLEDLRLWIESFRAHADHPARHRRLARRSHDRSRLFHPHLWRRHPRRNREHGRLPATLVIGRSMTRAADLLREQTGISDWRFDHLIGLPAATLLPRRCRKSPASRRRQNSSKKRDQLADAMVDCQFQFGGAKVGIAGDADLVGALTDFFVGMGSMSSPPWLRRGRAPRRTAD